MKLGSYVGTHENPAYLHEDCATHSQDVTFGLGPYYVSMKGYVDIRFREKPFVPYELSLLFAPETDMSHDLVWEHNLEVVPEFKDLRFLIGDFCSKEKKASQKYLPNTHLGACENHAFQIVKRKCKTFNLKKQFYIDEIKSMLNMKTPEHNAKCESISNGDAGWDSRMVSWWNHPNTVQQRL